MEPFIGQVMMFGGNFAPRGWALCQGQLLAISSHSALFSILGTIYGGDGRTTFGLPDLRGRVAIQQGSGPGLPTYRLGQKGGNYVSQLLAQNLPATQVTCPASNNEGNQPEPSTSNGVATPNTDTTMFRSSGTTTTGPGGGIVGAGSTQFSNQDPYQCVNYIIALEGIYPSRN